MLGYDDIALYYGRSTGFENRALVCAVTKPHTEMECKTSPGVGINHEFRVAAGKQNSEKGDQKKSYKPPKLLEISGSGATEAGTVGGQEILISGEQLGPPSMGVDPLSAIPLLVTYGRGDASRYTAASCVVVDNHIRVRCLTAPGVGKGHSWKLTVGGQTSTILKAGTSYAPPAITEYFGPGASSVVIDLYRMCLPTWLQPAKTFSILYILFFSIANYVR